MSARTLRNTVLAILLLCTVVQAQTPITGGNGLWYYEIGGAQAVSPPPNSRYSRVTLDASAELRLGYSCGHFDPVLSVTNILDDIAQGAEDMVDAMVLAAQAAIANLPAYILQRANPGLYDLFQNALLKAEETVNLATKTCQQMEAEVAQGKDPYREWVQLAMGNDWRMILGSEPDVVKAKAQVEDDGGDNGVPWLGGRQGGLGQSPINVIGDTVLAGYNLLLNRPLTATDPPVLAGAELPQLAILWAAPDEAQDWAVSVLGERHVTTCDACPKDTQPGVGLLLKIEEERAAVTDNLLALVRAEQPLTLAQLETVAAPGVAISAPVIQALRRLPPLDRSVLLGRLISEITTARVVEKALMLRRLLLSGQRVPEIQAAGVALKELQRAVGEIEREIDNLMFERQVRQGLVSQTAAILLRRDNQILTESFGQPRRPATDPYRIRDGAISSESAE